MSIGQVVHGNSSADQFLTSLIIKPLNGLPIRNLSSDPCALIFIHICWKIYVFLRQIDGWLVVWVFWHINLSRLFNAKSIFMQIVSSIPNNSV